MSWSISMTGKASAVTRLIPAKLDEITYLTGPEKGVFDAHRAAIMQALEGTAPDQIVSIVSNGHGNVDKYQTCKLEITPIHGWVE